MTTFTHLAIKHNFTLLHLRGSGSRGRRRDTSSLLLFSSSHLRSLIYRTALAAANLGHAGEKAVSTCGTFDNIAEGELLGLIKDKGKEDDK